MLSYLRRHSHVGAPSWLARADALDAQILVIAASWDLWRTELRHLRGGLSDGLFYDELGAALGLGPTAHVRHEHDPRPARRRRTGRGDPHQPARERLTTLTALLHYDDFDLDFTGPQLHIADPADQRRTWLAQHHEALTVVGTNLLAAADHHQVPTRIWLDHLDSEIADGSFNLATPAVLGLALAEIRTARPIVELTSRHSVHGALVAGDKLRCSYSGVGCHAHWRSPPPRPDTPHLADDIRRRRERVEDPRRVQLPASDTARPVDVLTFLRRCPSNDRGIRRCDHLSALALVSALWWVDRGDELWALRAGLRSRVFRTQLAAPYNISSGQGLQDRVDRLTSLSTRGRLDEKHTRQMRQPDTDPKRQEPVTATDRDRIDGLASDLLTIVAATLEIAEGERDWLDLLGAELRGDDRSGYVSSIVMLALAAAEVQNAVADSVSLSHLDRTAITALLATIDGLPSVSRIRRSTATGAVGGS